MKYQPLVSWFLTATVTLPLFGCGGASGSSAAGGGGAPTSSGAGGGSAAGPLDACGGKIFKAGVVDEAEYRRQATLWDRATIDCRLGPRFEALHPGGADDQRPMAAEVPKQADPGGFLCKEYQFGTLQAGGDYGSTSGQVAYAPDDASDPGLDRLQTCGWEKGIECHQPLQAGYLGGPHPDPGVTVWKGSAADLGLPVAIARTEMVETGDGLVAFTNGVIAATGTQTSGGSYPTVQLPPNKVPTALAITTYNEFALVTVWDTKEIRGQVAVIALRAPSPGSFSVDLFATANEGGFSSLQLLGFVDLPDLKAPTAIAAAGNNGGVAGAWVSSGAHAYQGIGSIFADTSYDAMLANDASWIWTGTPLENNAIFPTAGGAVVASRWEGKVTFLDLEPLFAFVRSVYVEPIKNKDNKALYESATTKGAWPFDFTTNPEMKPVVVTTVAVEHPTVVRIGNRAGGGKDGFEPKLKAWVGNLAGVVTAYDVSALSGRDDVPAGTPITKLSEVTADPNLTSMHLLGAYAINDSIVVSSRGNRSVQWIQAGKEAITVVRSLRDARLGDPVDTDPNDRRSPIAIADFAGRQVLSYELQSQDCGAGSDAGACVFLFDGGLSLPGTVYRVDTANVN